MWLKKLLAGENRATLEDQSKRGHHALSRYISRHSLTRFMYVYQGIGPRTNLVEDTENHPHKHSSSCGHTAIRHNDKLGYLHNSHLHKQEANKVVENAVAVNSVNAESCQNGKETAKLTKSKNHAHGPKCGHPSVPHGTHDDYVVNIGQEYRLHNRHIDHNDDHGGVAWVSGPKIK